MIIFVDNDEQFDPEGVVLVDADSKILIGSGLALILVSQFFGVMRWARIVRSMRKSHLHNASKAVVSIPMLNADEEE